MDEKFASYREFWPFYLREHATPLNRYLHFIGTALGIFLMLEGVSRPSFFHIIFALLVGYGFAWLGHGLVERNRPATFAYPVWSFLADLHMLALFVSGRLGAELKKHKITG